jgi:hypothetical protein
MESSKLRAELEKEERNRQREIQEEREAQKKIEQLDNLEDREKAKNIALEQKLEQLKLEQENIPEFNCPVDEDNQDEERELAGYFEQEGGNFSSDNIFEHELYTISSFSDL